MRGLLVIVLCLWAGTAVASDFDAKAAAGIVRIVVAGPENPDHVAIRDPDAVTPDSPDLGNRLFASITGGKSMTDRDMEATVERTDFDSILAERNVHLGAELRAAIADAMRRDGYTIQAEPSYNTDGALSVSFDRVQYNGPAYHSRLTPEIIVQVRFADMNSHEVLFDHTYSFTDSSVTRWGGTDITPAANFAFPSYDAILDDPDRAVAGMRSGIPLIANAIAADLRK